MSRQRTGRLLLATIVMGVTCGSGPLFAQSPHFGGFATRFTASGSVDTTFGDEGLRRVFEPDGGAVAAAIDADNRIVIAGTREGRFVVTRLSSSGDIDRSFGVATKAFAATAEAYAVALDPSGRIIVAGTSAKQFALACFTDAGEDCPFFGSGSKVTTAFPHPAEATAIAIDSKGRIVVGGRVVDHTGLRDEKFAMARYTATGGLDAYFGQSGKVVHDVAGPAPAVPPYEKNVELISGLAIDSIGRILAAGTFSTEHVSPRFALIRFHGNGMRDAAFGPDATGMVTGVGGCSWAGCVEEASALSLVVQPNGKIVVAGWARRLGEPVGAADVALARFLPDGMRDEGGFGIDGYVVTDLGGDATAASMKIAGADLYVAGFAFSGAQAMIARYALSDGTLEGGFGGGIGIVVGSSCPPTLASPAFALVVQRFPCRGGLCVPTYNPVIAGTCMLNP